MAAAAQGVSISGRIVSAGDGSPLHNANVLLIESPDTQPRGTVSNSEGRFTMENVRSGDYELRITYIGYKPVTRTIKVGTEALRLGRITMEEGDIRLGEVEVTGQAPAVVAREDTVEFHSQAYKVSRDATAEDLVSKMPGITVDGGTVRAQGEDVRRVLVDNREFFGEDPRAVLRNIPAEIIDRIQVFDQQSDQAQFTGFRDGNESKTINIVTRAMMRNATFGKLYGGFGESSHYRGGGNINFFDGDRRISVLALTNNVNEQNFSTDDLLGVLGSSSRSGGMRSIMSRSGFTPGAIRPMGAGAFRGGGGISDFMVDTRNGIATTHALGINYSDLWGANIEATGSYFFNFSSTETDNTLLREFIVAGATGQMYDEIERSDSDNMNHRLNMRVDWKIDSLNSLLIRPRLSLQQNDGNRLTYASTMLGDSPLNLGNSSFTSDLTGMNFQNSLLFRRAFATKGRTFSVELQTGLTRNEGENTLLSRYETFGQASRVDSLDQQGELLKRGLSLSTEAVYTEPLGERSMLQIRHSASYSEDDSDKKTYNFSPLSGFYDDLDPFVSNEFMSDYLTQSAGAGYRFDNDAAHISIDAAWQWATLSSERLYPRTGSLDRSFATFMPRAMLRWKISPATDLRLFYRSRTSPPSVDQLQDAVDNSNPLQLSMGNPELDQNYSHFMVMRYSTAHPATGGYFFSFIGATITTDHIGNSLVLAATDTVVMGVPLSRGMQLARPVNLDGNYSLRSFITYGRPVSWIKSNVNFNLFGSYSRTPSLINDELNYSYAPSLGLGVVVASNISENIDFTISSQTNINWIENSLQADFDQRYINQMTRLRLNWTIWKGIVFNSDLLHNSYTGLSEGYNDEILLWNLGIAKKFLADEQAELRLTLYDALNRNKSIIRNVTDTYIEDARSIVLQRYALLTFTYTIRAFGR